MRNWARAKFILCLGSFFLAGVLFAGSLENTLGKDLNTLRVSQIDANTHSVRYVPIKPSIGKMGEEKSGKPVCLQVGNKVILQGLIGFFAAPEEVQELEARAKKELGDDARVIFEPPAAFSLQVALKGKEIFSRPKTGGTITGIPFQTTVEKPQKEPASYPLVLHAVFYGNYAGMSGYRSMMMTEASASTQIATNDHGCSIKTVTSSETVNIELQETHLGEASLTIDETFLLEF